MAEVIVNVKGNTTQAQDSVDDLNKSLNQTADAADDASASLEKQEARIKTLGGAINLIGGSVEILAGGLAATGALSEENAEQFTAAAVSALAFADGTKRVFEGYKELKEGLGLYKNATKAAEGAQKGLNKAVLANPYVLVLAALAALTAGIVAYKVANDEAGQRQARINELNQKALDIIGDQVTDLKVLQAIVNDVAVSEEKRETALAKLAEVLPELKFLDLDRKGVLEDINTAIEREIELISQRARVAAAEESLTDIYKEQLKLQSEIERLEAGRLTAGEKIAFRTYLSLQGTVKKYKNELKDAKKEEEFFTNYIVENTSPALEGLGEDLDNTKGKIDALPKQVEINIKPKIIVPEGDDSPPTLAEWWQANVIDAIEGPELQPIIKPEFDSSALDLGTTTFLDKLVVFEGKIDEFFESVNGQAVGAVLGAASKFTEALVTVVDDGSEEAFESSKKFKIAEVITSAAQASFEAFAAAQKLNATVPGLGTILGVALVGAISTSANRAIQNIQSSTFDGGNLNTNISGGGVNTPAGQFGGQGPAINRTIVGGTIEDRPIRAYVVGGDISDELAASEALQRRRALGTG